MIKRVLILGAGAAAGWIGHTAFSKGRQQLGDRADRAVRDAGNPETWGQQVGQMAASALAAGARGFASQLRDEVPSWRTAGEPRSTSGESTDPGHRSAPRQQARSSSTSESPDPEAERRAAEHRAQLQERMKDIAASTDWRAVAEAAASRNWRGAANSFISTGLSGSRTTAPGQTIPGTVADPTPTDPSNPGERKQS